jgi:putative oxidoreductase
MKFLTTTKYNENGFGLGLAVLRIGFGMLMLTHGFDKLTHYETVKGMNQLFGAPIDGILVIFAEFICSIFLILGLFTRVAAIPLIITMAIAFFKAHQGNISGENNGTEALLYLIGFVAILFTGAGKFSVDRMIGK